MAQFEALLGDTLRSADGKDVKTADELADVEAVGLYFSAHWCPPCRGFTPKLSAIYKNLTGKGLKFKIVFVSSDRDEAAYTEYHDSMGFPALPFSEAETKKKLSQKYKVAGIPTLVLLDKNGKTITKDGRSAITGDPEGANFPWVPPTVAEALGTDFVTNGGQKVTSDALEGKYIGIYFSAHWCPPCRGFTPKLVETYKTLKAAGKDVEFIFASSDRDEGQFNEYFGEMPWLAVPFADRARKETLSNLFGVEGIPTFVMLDKDRSVISTSARGDVDADPQGADFPWFPKPVKDLANPDGINETTSLVVFLGKSSDEERTAITGALTGIAEAVNAKAKEAGDDPDMIFFTSTGTGPAAQIRKLTKLADSDKPQVVLLDIPDSGGFYNFPADKEVTGANVEEFLAAYKSGSLERQQLS